MHHLVARALPGTLLVRTHAEAAALWEIVVRTFPEVLALCIMPDHLHLLLPHGDEADRLTDAMRAFEQARNRGRGERSRVWDFPHPPADAVADEQKARRSVRYVHLNPCRAKLVADPLAWPWSTHRDAVGFAATPVIPRRADASAFHAYVSADDSVCVEGTALPYIRFADHPWNDVLSTVSAVCRIRPSSVLLRGPARVLALRTAWAHGLREPTVLARLAGTSRVTVWRTCRGAPPRGARVADTALDACIRAVGDDRFRAIGDRPLWFDFGWGRYRRLR